MKKYLASCRGLPLLLLLLAGCLPAAVPGPMPTPTLSPRPNGLAADADIFAKNQRLGRGVNLGNALEAPQTEGEWGMKIEAGFMPLIRAAGFQHVRVPIRWNAHAVAEAPYTIDPVFFRRIDEVIQQALDAGLVVLINMHNYDDLMLNPPLNYDRFVALWEQIATHYQSYPPELFFELLNEPNSLLTAERWNPLALRALAVVRRTNPQRAVVIGPDSYNAVGRLFMLQLPDADRNLIATVHYYNPFQFTHQGAEWAAGSDAWLGTSWTATEAQKTAVLRDFDEVAQWGKQNRRPIYLGEFGAYSKAQMEYRTLWTAFVARSAEERQFSWAYWEFGAGFGVYDRTARQWNSALLQSLIPKP